jgi:hypothetical protein
VGVRVPTQNIRDICVFVLAVRANLSFLLDAHQQKISFVAVLMFYVILHWLLLFLVFIYYTALRGDAVVFCLAMYSFLPLNPTLR